MARSAETVVLVDDDSQVLKALTRLLESHGMLTRSFTTGQEFLAAYDPAMPGCVVLDLLMPAVSGLDVQRALQQIGCPHPIIFLSGQAEIRDCAEAMKSRAFDFLTKPIEAELFLKTVMSAIEADAFARATRAERLELEQRMKRLSPRERQVMAAVIEGLRNKQIAAQLGVVEKTVKVHRSQMFRKLGIRTIADLVRIALRLSLDGTTTLTHGDVSAANI